MPSIATATEQITSFPNLFISPYGNDGIIPLYSSIPIDNRVNADCLPCVLCGNSTLRHQVIVDNASVPQPIKYNSIQIALT